MTVVGTALDFCEVARRLKALRDASETRGPGVTHGPAR